MENFDGYDNYYAKKYHLGEFSDEERTSYESARRSRISSSRHSSGTRARSTGSRKRTDAPKKAAPSRTKKAQKTAAPKRTAPKKASKPARVKTKAPKQSKKPSSKGKKALVTVIAVLIVLAIGAAASFVGVRMYYDYKKSLPFKYSEGVNVEGVDIGGLSYKDALKKLKQNKLSFVRDVNLVVSANETKKSYNKKDFSYKFDYKTPLEEARIYSLKEQNIYEEPNGKVKDTEPFSTRANPEFNIDYNIVKSSVEKKVAALAKKVDKEPKNARVTKFKPFASSKFTYKRGKLGYRLEQSSLTEQIYEFLAGKSKSGTITAEVTELTPEITYDDLVNNIVGLSRNTSISYNTKNGNINMATALKACNGSIIEPGAIWSFNTCTGDSNLESNGYKPATVISEHELDEGVGGGICQASTTIFKAAALANMSVVERHNHYWASGYAYAGEDATIDYPNLDLRLRNDTKYQMFIECRMEGTTLVCNVYGYQNPSYDNVRLRSENYDIEEEKSFRTRTYRTLYKDHKIVSDDVICTSYYSLTDDHIVRIEDEGTFRTKVNGSTQSETEPATEEE